MSQTMRLTVSIPSSREDWCKGSDTLSPNFTRQIEIQVTADVSRHVDGFKVEYLSAMDNTRWRDFVGKPADLTCVEEQLAFDALVACFCFSEAFEFDVHVTVSEVAHG